MTNADTTSDFSLDETHVEEGGVFRCCAGTVAQEYEGKRVQLGNKSKCAMCGRSFTLVRIEKGMTTAFRNPTGPVWKPDDQLGESDD